MRFTVPLSAALACITISTAASSDEGHRATTQVKPQASNLQAPKLQEQWVASGFSAPEGVALAMDGHYFISNVAGEGSAKDNNGFISKLSATGEIIDLHWADGLNGPKGMALLDGRLYVSDIDRVVVFAVESAERVDEIAVSAAMFLNDATVWNGAVYVSDSGTGRIHRIANGSASLWLEDARFTGINGLLGDGPRMLASTMDSGSLLSISPSGSITVIASGMENADGIGIVAGGYLVSSWPGQIHFVASDGTVTTLHDSQASGTLQNDLSVFGEQVIVPNWQPGTVTAWQLKR